MTWFDQLLDGTAAGTQTRIWSTVPAVSGGVVAYQNYNVVNCLYTGAIEETPNDITGEIKLEGVRVGVGALLLPWAENHIVWGQLTGAATQFLTHQVNGCGVIISGARSLPVVVHANEIGDNLSPMAVKASKAKASGKKRARERCNIYRDFENYLDHNVPGFGGDIATWYPGEDYYGMGGVFGVYTAGVWRIFGHAWGADGKKTVTKVIWPVDAVVGGANRNPCKCCYITTAVCGALGLPDDCAELRALRWFRDNVMATTVEGRRDIEQYYETAPRIVEAINRRSDSRILYRSLYQRSIRPAVAAVRRGDFDEAYAIYRAMVVGLERRGFETLAG